MPKSLPPPPIPEIPIEQVLEGFDEENLAQIVRGLQAYELELKQRRQGKILFISLKACEDLRRAVYEWAKIREQTDRLRQLRNKPDTEQEPYKHLITLVTEAQYALAEIFTDATTPLDGESYFGRSAAKPAARKDSAEG
jgi:hypothetical protein